MMSTQYVEEMSHLSAIGYLWIVETQLETWETDVAFHQTRVKAVLGLTMIASLFPRKDH